MVECAVDQDSRSKFLLACEVRELVIALNQLLDGRVNVGKQRTVVIVPRHPMNDTIVIPRYRADFAGDHDVQIPCTDRGAGRDVGHCFRKTWFGGLNVSLWHQGPKIAKEGALLSSTW